MTEKRTPQRHSGLRTDPKISELLHDSVENRAALTRKQKWDRARKKATYDLSPELQDAVTEIARKEDTSTSQIVGVFLTYAVAQYQQKEVRLVRPAAEMEEATVVQTGIRINRSALSRGKADNVLSRLQE